MPAGSVISQSPDGSSSQKEGSTITIFVSTGKKDINVTLDDTEGEGVEGSRIVHINELYGDLPTPTRTGYHFDGWFTSKDGGVQIKADSVVIQPNAHALYAHWTPNQYTVLFDSNGGSASNSSRTVTFDSDYGELPNLSRTGYSFDGWFNSSGTPINANTKVQTPSDHTLSAHWTANTYTVSLNANGGSVSSSSKKITYDFTKDAEAQNCLKLAKKYAGNSLRLTLFHNSPPVEMTVNGKAFCNSGVSNLASENFGLYSDFCIGVADYFVKQGYRVTDVSPVNEPIYGWDGNNQEGCYYEPEQLSQLLAIMASKARGKSYKISMFEAGAAEAELENGETPLNIKYFKAITGNKTNSAYYDSVSVHSYWSNKERKAAFRSFINKYNPNMKIACTEYCQMTNDGSTGVYDISSPLADNDPERNGLGIEYGLQMARTVYEDLTVLNASEWDWWLGVSNGYYPDGLVYIDHNDSDDSVVLTSKRLWCLGNFSRFIKEGAKRIEVTSVNDKVLSCGFKNPDGSVALVLINTTENNYGTNICLDGYSSYKTYITSASKDLAYSTGGTFEKGSAVSLPAKSVVSVIITK